MKKLTAAERLIVAADYKPLDAHPLWWAEDQVLALAENLRGTGVYIKVNSALRASGYSLVNKLHDRGLRVFADLKLYDIPQTLAIDGALLRKVCPELLTTVCSAGVSAMKALKAELPYTEVLGVTVLTSLKDADTKAMFSCSTAEAVLRFAQVGADAKNDGLISSPAEVEVLRAKFGLMMSLNTPAIRPEFAIVAGDDQNPERIMTPAKAIRAGADRLVIGRPITEAQNPRDAVMRTLEEIESVMA